MSRTTAKEKLIAAALDLMAERDYTVISVDEICERAGVSKGSFYHFFKSKEDLGLTAIWAYFRESLDDMAAAEFMRRTDPVERAFGFLDYMESMADRHYRTGCLFGNVAVGIARSQPRFQHRIGKVFDGLAEAFAALLAPFASEDASDGLPSAKELAELYLSVMEGSIVMGRAHSDPERIRKGQRWFRQYLEALVPR